MFNNRFFKPTVATSLSDTIDLEDAAKELSSLFAKLEVALKNKQNLLRYLHSFPKEEPSYNLSPDQKLRIEKQWLSWLNKISPEELEQVKKLGINYIKLDEVLKNLYRLLPKNNNLTMEAIKSIVVKIIELSGIINTLPTQLYLTPGNKSQLDSESKSIPALPGIKTLVVDHIELISLTQEFQFVANCCMAFLSKGKQSLPEPKNLREALLGFKLFPNHYSAVLQKSHLHDEEKSTAKKCYKIPKKLHGIWVGSKLSPAYYQNLVAKCKRARHHEINLWTFDDDILRKAGMGTRRERKAAKNSAETGLFHDVAIPKQGRIRIRNIRKELYPKIDEIFPENIASIIKQIIDLESEGFKNFATVSDLLRLIILAVEGGWYNDMDDTVQLRLNIDAWHSGTLKSYAAQLKNILTEKEYQQFLLATDPDFRTEKCFENIMNVIREKLYLYKLPLLQQALKGKDKATIKEEMGPQWAANPEWGKRNEAYIDAALKKDQIAEAEKEYGTDIWRHWHEEKYEDVVDKIWERYVHGWNKEGCLEKDKPSNDWAQVKREMQKDMAFKQPSAEVGFYHNEDNNSFMGATPNHPLLYHTISSFLLKYIQFDYQKPELQVDSLDFARKNKLSIVGLTQVTNLDLKRQISRDKSILNKPGVDPRSIYYTYPRFAFSVALGPGIASDTTSTMKEEEKRKMAQNLEMGGIKQESDKTWLGALPTSQDTLNCPRFSF